MAVSVRATVQLFNLPRTQRGFFSCSPVRASPPRFCSFRFCRFPVRQSYLAIRASSSAAGTPYLGGDENPYEVLGVSPIMGFDKIKTAYARKRKEAEKNGDDEFLADLERAYDKIMMHQLQKRKQGLTFGSFKVSKDIKYADKEPIVPWGPRYSRCTLKDMRINMAISAVFTAWIFITRSSQWRPMQFMAFAFFYRIFEKLKAFEPNVAPTYNIYGEDEGKGMRMGKRMLRSLGLVFGCIAVASLGYTGILNLIEMFSKYVPLFVYNNQELFVTTASSVLLYIMASYYR
ncbi:chloroplast J-like domain 1 [Carex rostrata]